MTRKPGSTLLQDCIAPKVEGLIAPNSLEQRLMAPNSLKESVQTAP